MLYFLAIFLVILGLFFISLGMLFINYKASPLSKIIEQEYVYKDNKLGMQILIPGVILIFVATKVMNFQG